VTTRGVLRYLAVERTSHSPRPPIALHAVEHAPDGVLIVDSAGSIVYANRAMVAMTGYPRLIGKSVDDLVPESARGRHAGLRKQYERAPTRRPMGSGLSLTLHRADGGETPVEIALSPLQLDETFVITVVRDVSERLEAESRLNAAHEQLALVEERERIGRDLHDVVLQHLYGMGLTLQAVAASAGPEVASRLDQVVEDVDRVISEVRTIVFTLGTRGASAALGPQLADVVALASRVLGFTPTLRLEGPVDSVLTDEVRTEMIASMREALGNVARHADASTAHVVVSVEGGQVVMTVTDDGVGPPDADQIRAGNGLVNLAQRAAAFGGTCSLEPGPNGQGAVLRWSAPF